MDKQERKQKLKQWKEEQQQQGLRALPLPTEEMQKLFNSLRVELSFQACDHSRRLTIASLKSKGQDVDKVCQWLDENGGYCDCEILFNSQEHFENLRPFD